MTFKFRPRAGAASESTAAERAAARWYVAVDSAVPGASAEAALEHWRGGSAEHADALARCHAAVELTELARARPALRAAFADATALARGVHAARPVSAWYRRPAVAWSIAGAASLLAIASWLVRPAGMAPDAMPGTSAGTATASVGTASAGTASAGTSSPGPAARPASAVLPPELTERFGATGPAVVLPGEVVVDARSVAVLPFSGAAELAPAADVDPATLALAGRLYEDVLRQLDALPGFYVVDRESVAAYTREDVPLEDLAATLGVRGIVEASVATSGGEVSVTLRLTDAYHRKRTEESIDRPAAQLALLDSDIAANIALAFVDGAELSSLELPQSYGGNP